MCKIYKCISIIPPHSKIAIIFWAVYHPSNAVKTQCMKFLVGHSCKVHFDFDSSYPQGHCHLTEYKIVL